MSMFKQSTEWTAAHAMAAHLPEIKNKKAKRLQKLLICRQWIKAMKGSNRG